MICTYRLNDDEHGVKQPHATSFPNGCALGATWSKQRLRDVGRAIAMEARGLHNGFVHEGTNIDRTSLMRMVCSNVVTLNDYLYIIHVNMYFAGQSFMHTFR